MLGQKQLVHESVCTFSAFGGDFCLEVILPVCLCSDPSKAL